VSFPGGAAPCLPTDSGALPALAASVLAAAGGSRGVCRGPCPATRRRAGPARAPGQALPGHRHPGQPTEEGERASSRSQVPATGFRRACHRLACRKWQVRLGSSRKEQLGGALAPGGQGEASEPKPAQVDSSPEGRAPGSPVACEDASLEPCSEPNPPERPCGAIQSTA